MNINDIIKKLPFAIATPIMLHLTILLGITQLDRLDVVFPYLALLRVGNPLSTTVITLSLLYLLMVASYILLYLKYRDKLIPKFGVLWDKNKEAYCPACRNPLSHYVTWASESPGALSTKAFECVKCDKRIMITHNGDVIELDDARKML